MAVYPSNMAPFGLKLWENAFQMNPEILCSDTDTKLPKIFDHNFRQKKFRLKIDKLPVLEELMVFGHDRQMHLEK